jgi:ABC-2 type transport system ATP-binding protein
MDKSAIREAVDKAKTRCGIMHFSDRLIRNLSGGYQQRVGIAQAIVHNPKFVVLDEPTNGLDPNQILEIRELIKEIATDHSVLLSTHILSEVQATCGYIRMIEHGNVVFTGTMEEFNNYVKPDSFIVYADNLPSSETLTAIQGINSIEDLGAKKYRIHFEGGRETMQRLIEESVKNNWGLSEITLDKSSLEEVFAQLSGKRKPKA